MLSSEIFNALIGPSSSVIMNKFYVRKFGKHRFWITVTSVPLLLVFIAMWFHPFQNTAGKIAYHLITILLFNLFYGTMLVAYEGKFHLNIARDSLDTRRVT